MSKNFIRKSKPLIPCKCGMCFESFEDWKQHKKDTRRWRKYHSNLNPGVIMRVFKRKSEEKEDKKYTKKYSKRNSIQEKERKMKVECQDLLMNTKLVDEKEKK